MTSENDTYERGSDHRTAVHVYSSEAPDGGVVQAWNDWKHDVPQQGDRLRLADGDWEVQYRIFNPSAEAVLIVADPPGKKKRLLPDGGCSEAGNDHLEPRLGRVAPRRHISGSMVYTLAQDLGTLPEIVCLCGSTRFKDEYRAENKRLTLEGKIVLSVGFFGHVEGWPDDGEDGETKVDLDELHKQKIDLADRIHVINVDGYVGDSTRGEIQHARKTGTDISWYNSDETSGIGDTGREQ